MSTSSSDKDSYNNVCKLAVENDSVFNTFKQNQEYLRIVEHLNKPDGQTYLNYIINNHKYLLDHIEKFKTNDIIGSTAKSFYPETGEISPTTIRYIYILSKLIENFQSLDNIDIVEIGGGYGGQCKIIYDYFKPKSYTIIDIHWALQLQKKYLSKFNLDINCVIYPNVDIIHSDLLISNWAITECNKDVREIYINRVVNNAKRFFICANYYDGFEDGEIGLINKKEDYILEGYNVAVLIK